MGTHVMLMQGIGRCMQAMLEQLEKEWVRSWARMQTRRQVGAGAGAPVEGSV